MSDGIRIRLLLALEALDDLGKHGQGLTADELKLVRDRRAREMLTAAQLLYTEITGQHISTPRGAV